MTGPVIPRGSLDVTKTDLSGGVCYFESPSKFYICALDKIESFTTILEKSQNEVAGKVNPVLGTCCLALDDGTCWYRAEILSIR